ncbi:hypothetical protein M378DRAFT_162717, partial [Amanita muscaria Koide BX008]
MVPAYQAPSSNLIDQVGHTGTSDIPIVEIPSAVKHTIRSALNRLEYVWGTSLTNATFY